LSVLSALSSKVDDLKTISSQNSGITGMSLEGAAMNLGAGVVIGAALMVIVFNRGRLQRRGYYGQ
jgi:hypothetical protein